MKNQEPKSGISELAKLGIGNKELGKLCTEVMYGSQSIVRIMEEEKYNPFAVKELVKVLKTNTSLMEIYADEKIKESL